MSPRLLVLTLFISSAAMALDPSRSITQYVHRSWQTEDGLPQISASTITQTPDGYLWIGTDSGLARFDGVRFTVFNRTNTPQLRDNLIRWLLCDPDGSLWIATNSGLTLYSHGQFQVIESVPAQPIYSLYLSRAGEVWAGAHGVVYIGRSGRFQARKLPADKIVVGFAENSAGMWVAGGDRLFQLTASGDKEYNGVDSHDDLVNCIAGAGDDIWIGTTHGAVRMRNGVFERNAAPSPIRDTEVWTIFVDRDKVMWFGTRRGAMRLRGANVEVYTTAEGLTDDYVDWFFEDREGSLWLGTHLGGLNQLRAAAVTTFSRSEGLRANSVWSVFPDPVTGSVFVGSEGGGLAMIRDGRVTPFGPRDGFASSTITTLGRDGTGTLWVGTYDRGLYALHDGIWANVTKKNGLACDTVTALVADGPVMWVGTLDGVSRIEGGRITSYHDGILSPYILSMARSGGVLWIGTGRGLARLDGQRFVHTSGSTPFPDQETYCIHADADGTIWAGLHNGVLAVSRDGRTRVLTARNGLPDNDIVHIEQDRSGDFWLASVRGIVRVPRAEMESGRILHARVFDTADGMKSSEGTWGVQPGSGVAADGSLWFPTVRGAVRLDPTAVDTSGVPLMVWIERISVDGRTESSSGTVDVPPGAEKLEFQYAAPSFAAPSRIRFRYRLVGYDPSWIEAGNERVARYTHIPPGEYTFLVMADDGSGTWSSQQVQAQMTLHPRFIQTIWFYLSCVAALALVIAWIYAARMRRLGAQYAAVLAERNRIAREFHDTLAQTLVVLSQQLHLARTEESEASDTAHEALDNATMLAKQCLVETRRSLLDLRAEVLERAGLPAAIETIAARVCYGSAIDPKVEIAGTPRQLDGRVEQNILRIAQEAISNAVRHSGAKSLAIALHFFDDRVELSIIDDGSGPPSKSDSGPLQLGLVGILERVKVIRGTLQVKGAPGKGTTVHVSVPMTVALSGPRLMTRVVGWSTR